VLGTPQDADDLPPLEEVPAEEDGPTGTPEVSDEEKDLKRRRIEAQNVRPLSVCSVAFLLGDVHDCSRILEWHYGLKSDRRVTIVAHWLQAKDRGNKHYSKKEFDAALVAYEEAIGYDPTNMTFLNNKAAVFFEQGDYER
jgi:tetratricopeptide (TPR) repeat protein